MAKCLLPKLDGCVKTKPRPVSLSDRRVSQAIFIFVTVTVLSLGHIYLKFSMRDMRLQHSKLQQHAQMLRREESSLRFQNEALCDTESLRTHGTRDLSMVEVQPTDRQDIRIPVEWKDRYAGPRGFSVMDEAENNRGVKEIFLSLVDVNKAFAGQK